MQCLEPSGEHVVSRSASFDMSSVGCLEGQLARRTCNTSSMRAGNHLFLFSPIHVQHSCERKQGRISLALAVAVAVAKDHDPGYALNEAQRKKP